MAQGVPGLGLLRVGRQVLRVALCPRKGIKRPLRHIILHIFRSRRFLVIPCNLSQGAAKERTPP